MKETTRIPDWKAVLARGINYLGDHQFHHGEFCTYQGEGEYLEKWCVTESVTFSTAAICTSLLPLRGDQAVEAIFSKGAAFLRYHMMRGGTWNFFTVWNKLFPLCPPDLDSTCCIAYFLRQLDFPFPDNRYLVWSNRSPGGLFYTWFTFRLGHLFHLPRRAILWKLLLREYKHPLASLVFWMKSICSKDDIDAVVNANVLFYLGNDPRLMPVIDYLIRVVLENREASCDKWYRNPFELYYALARNYAAGMDAFSRIRQNVIGKVLTRVGHDGCIGHSPADTAMALIVLIQFGYTGPELPAAVRYLCESQAANGSWRRQALCYGSASVVFGSEELTTALCVESLARYDQLKKSEDTGTGHPRS